ncbi:MAG: M20/M25/M40 family metallo-hydrolase [Proteobacteria bacterium]|nr:M20/M25/M40 family metallo-hydrolase [Pseudomonadota bacterium]
MINEQRLIGSFIKLSKIDSPSRHEGAISKHLKLILEGIGANPVEDGASKTTGGESGNLLAKIKGNKPSAPTIVLNAHMDTVAPGRGVYPVIRDGVIYSSGNTILGSDDKSGIAIILEVIRSLKEQELPHGDIEVLFTVCEEVGLLGAKSFDTSLLDAKFGYSLDSTKVGTLVIAAPTANHIKFTIHGKEAHAGVAPEDGISAIKLAGHALAKMPLGRIDEETSANIGIIQGGTATNIVPGMVVLEGEARSHCTEKLLKQTNTMVKCMEEAVNTANREGKNVDGARLDVEVSLDFPLMHLDKESPPVKLAQRAAMKLDRVLNLIVGGGGSDANIFNGKGIEMAIMPTGMTDVHTNAENIKIDDMVITAELLLQTLIENCR